MFRDIQTITCVCEGTRDTCSGSVVVLFLTPRFYRRGNQAVRQVDSSQLSLACLFGKVIMNHLSCKLAFNPDFIVCRTRTFHSLQRFLPSLSGGSGASFLLNKVKCIHLSSRQMLSYWYYLNQFILSKQNNIQLSFWYLRKMHNLRWNQTKWNKFACITSLFAEIF